MSYFINKSCEVSHCPFDLIALQGTVSLSLTMKSHGLLHGNERIPNSRPSSAEKERRRRKTHQEMLIADVLVPIEIGVTGTCAVSTMNS